jgi:peptidoglycan/LPS O-acetylase OafA/YrhL
LQGQNLVTISYRAYIDGLRAVAVVPVVLFHVGAPIFSGGFVGVDVFFVISGYLITSLILPEVKEGRFSIASFYERRARRIFPALFAVLAFCCIVGFAVLTPADYKTLGQSVIATTTFVSNIFFWRQANYFAAPASENPLLHTWSLSIEEQFYLFYPLILVLASRLLSASRLTVIATISAISFAAGAVLVFFKPAATFYLGPTRAWELLIGGLIVLAGTDSRPPGWVLSSAAWSGPALIVSSMLTYTSSTRFPGAAALLPVMGTALLIWSGQYQATVVHRFLSLPVLTAVGKASYSLYLWHFPIIAFVSYVKLSGLDWRNKTAICIVSLILSFLSLRYIERPFRLPSKERGLRKPVQVAISGMALVFGAGLLIVGGAGFPFRLDQASAVFLAAEQDKERHRMDCLTLEQRIVRPNEACKLGSADANPTIAIWGDSHAVVTASALAETAEKNHASLLLAASVDCPIGIGFGIDPHIGSDLAANPGYQYCQQYNSEMLEFVRSNPSISVVVLSSRWTNWRLGEPGSAAEAPVDIRLRDSRGTASSPAENKEIFVRGFEALLQALVAAGKTVWIVGPVPEPSFRIPKALFVEHLGLDHTNLDVPLSAFLRKNQFILSVFADMKRKFPVNFIWPQLALCDESKCPVSDDGHPVFFDDNHLSLVGAHKTSYLYQKIFQDLRHDHVD